MNMSQEQTIAHSHSSMFNPAQEDSQADGRLTGLADAQPSRDALARSVKRRATQACQNCRARKIRCDVAKRGAPCIHCRLDEIECVVPESRRRRNKPITEKQTTSSRSLDGFHSSDCVPSASFIRPDSEEQSSLHRDDSHANPARNANVRVNSQASLGKATPSQEPPDVLALPAYIKPLPKRFGVDDVTYLQSKGALIIPPPELRNELIRSFLEHMHPFMSLLDWPDFLRIIYQNDGQQSVSLLLFQAVMLSGVPTVPIRFLDNAGFSSRREARRICFTRVRLLYDLDYEDDSIALLQSLILMTYFREVRHGGKETHHWAEIAVSLCRKIGLNRDPEQNPTLTPAQQRLYKRIWWCLYVRDTQVALGTQGPPRIKDIEFDVPMLRTTDFDLDPLPLISQIPDPAHYHAVRDAGQQHELAVMCVELTKLNLIIFHILCVHYGVFGLKGSLRTAGMLFKEPSQPGTSHMQIIAQSLQEWHAGLSPTSKYSPPSVQDAYSPSACLVLHRSWLHMVYYATMFCLHRPCLMAADQDRTRTIDPQLLQASRKAVKLASGQITTIACALADLNLVQFLPSPTITVLLPAIYVNLRESLKPAETLCQESLQNFCKCLQIMSDLREMYAAADYSTAFLQAAIDHTEIGPGTAGASVKANNTAMMEEAQLNLQTGLQMEATSSVSAASQLSSHVPQTVAPFAAHQQNGRVDSRTDTLRDETPLASSLNSARITSVSPFEHARHVPRYNDVSLPPQNRMFGAAEMSSNPSPSGMMPYHHESIPALMPNDQSRLAPAGNLAGERSLHLATYDFGGMQDMSNDYTLAAHWMSSMGPNRMMMVDEEVEPPPS